LAKTTHDDATRSGWWRACLRALRRFGGAVAPTLVTIALLEVVLRIALSLAHGGSQYYLFYGFHGMVGRVGISPWSVNDGGYYKFPPNYVLRGAAGQGDTETASTNSLGFRGPDFEPQKPAGTFRVIALGESSTFGFHNTDTSTYPYLLQELFRDHALPYRVEVINAGFPYYNSSSILNLLTHELGDYAPDLLTLYNGYNDCGWPEQVNLRFRAQVWLQRHSAIYLVFKEYVLTDKRYYKLQARLQSRLPAIPGEPIDERFVDDTAEVKAARYRRNVMAIAAFAKQRNIPLVLIRQPATTAWGAQRSDYESYESECRLIREKLAGGQPISGREVQQLIHHRLLRELDEIAREQDLPVVDNVAIVDQDRRRLTTWVHLTREGNARLAEALKAAIEPFVIAAAQRESRSAEALPATR
jgi:lysophospholipase L1-like esterase